MKSGEYLVVKGFPLNTVYFLRSGKVGRLCRTPSATPLI
jgi:hypothetical protein